MSKESYFEHRDNENVFKTHCATKKHKKAAATAKRDFMNDPTIFEHSCYMFTLLGLTENEIERIDPDVDMNNLVSPNAGKKDKQKKKGKKEEEKFDEEEEEDMDERNSKKNQKDQIQNKNMKFEEMEKAEEFGMQDFLIGVGVGIAIGSIAIIT